MSLDSGFDLRYSVVTRKQEVGEMGEKNGIALTVKVDKSERLGGLFTENTIGWWFCDQLNGILWDYGKWGVQFAQATPERAAQVLWDHACDEELKEVVAE